jgi:nucleoid DNA-binding protein
MDILFYLKELLKSHKTVSITGIGTLYKKKSPGKYDEIKHAFIPPSYTLSFTKDIHEPENLINLIAQKENIDFNTAKLQINEFVEKTLNELTEQQKVTLDGLGEFILTNNEITFIASKDGNFENEFYGFPILNETINPEEEKTTDVEENSDKVDQKDSDVSDLNSTLNPLDSENQTRYIGKPFTPNFDYEDSSDEEMSKSLKISLRILSIIGIIALIIGLAYFFKPDFFDNTILNNDDDALQTAAVVVVQQDSLIKKDTLANVDTNKILNLDTNLSLKNLPDTLDNKVTTYEVIGSAEKTQKRIDLVINRMKKRGIEAKALENIPGKLIKISLGSFTDFNLAKKYQDSLRKKLNNPEIYIQTIKPKK